MTSTGSSQSSVPSSTPEAKKPQFGLAFRYATGLTITARRDGTFDPSPYIIRAPGVARKFKITIVNGTERVFSAAQLHISLAAGSRNVPQIYDDANGIVARPERRLKPGAQAVFEVGFWVPAGQPFTVVVAPAQGYDEITLHT